LKDCNELRRQRGVIIKDMRALTDMAHAENRELTVEESEQYSRMESDQERLRFEIERFKRRFSSVPPQAFQLTHVDRYVQWQQKAGLKNASINRELSALRHMFSWAVKRGYLEANPIASIEKLQEQEWAGPKPTNDIVEAVLEKLDPRFLPVFTLIRETGARRGEVLTLQHWQIDRREKLITFAKQTKNGKNTVALSPRGHWRP
jgi:site-specific recombinase XerD